MQKVMHYKRKQIMTRVMITALIGIFAVTMITPFIWMLSASMKISADVRKLCTEWIPKYLYLDNYKTVWNIGGAAMSRNLFMILFIITIVQSRGHKKLVS